MHPAISAWPSAFFYEGQIADAPGVLPGPGVGGRAAPWHAAPCFPPLAFWDCLEVGRGWAGLGWAELCIL